MKPRDMSGHELVLAYAAACNAAREPMPRECERILNVDGEDYETAPCYYRWKYERDALYSDGSMRERERATDEDMAKWCDACRENELVQRRRAVARKRRGLILRAMQAYAKRKQREESGSDGK